MSESDTSADESAGAIDAIAGRVAALVPDDGRAEGHRLLTEIILPVHLKSLATHPKPARLMEIVEERLVERLTPATPDERLDEIRSAATSAEIRRFAAESLSLAIARFLQLEPDARASTAEWVDDSVERWIGCAPEDIASEAARRLDALDALRERVADVADIWNQHRLDFVRTELTIRAAQLGVFDVATGSLLDFLHAAGATPRPLDLH